jgi:hypothetical protein
VNPEDGVGDDQLHPPESEAFQILNIAAHVLKGKPFQDPGRQIVSRTEAARNFVRNFNGEVPVVLSAA